MPHQELMGLREKGFRVLLPRGRTMEYRHCDRACLSWAGTWRDVPDKKDFMVDSEDIIETDEYGEEDEEPNAGPQAQFIDDVWLLGTTF
jgi:hypothetical protein